MSADFQYDVFLSHNAQDKPRVRRLAERLKAAGVHTEAGLRLWLDEWVIQAGDSIALKVDEGLEQSRVLLLCLSQAALASGWVALERSTAVHRAPANAGHRFIPLLLGDCALPDTVGRCKGTDFRRNPKRRLLMVPAMALASILVQQQSCQCYSYSGPLQFSRISLSPARFPTSNRFEAVHVPLDRNLIF